MKYPNCVSVCRQKQGLTREALAATAGITRQALGLIEAGKVCPSTLVAIRLGRALGLPVEDLFIDPNEEYEARYVQDAGLPGTSGDRAFVGNVGGTWIARPAALVTHTFHTPVQGIIQGVDPRSDKAHVRLLHGREAVHKTVFASGCEMGLGLLASYVAKTAHAHQGVWFQASNQRALQELEDGITHVAAIHGPEGSDQSHRLSMPHRRIHFARAQFGWMLTRGNPLSFHDASELASGRIRLVNRETGAGVRALLDRELRVFGVAHDGIPGYGEEVYGHMAVAEYIARGFADVGIGHAAAAAVYGLDFIPLQEETCTLYVPDAHFHTESVQALLEALHTDSFRYELGQFGPYDVQNTGKVV